MPTIPLQFFISLNFQLPSSSSKQNMTLKANVLTGIIGKMISNQGALATEWHCNYLWCPAEQTNRHIHWQISSRGRKKMQERTKQAELFWNCSSVSSTWRLSSPSHLFLTLRFLLHLSTALSFFSLFHVSFSSSYSSRSPGFFVFGFPNTPSFSLWELAC